MGEIEKKKHPQRILLHYFLHFNISVIGEREREREKNKRRGRKSNKNRKSHILWVKMRKWECGSPERLSHNTNVASSRCSGWTDARFGGPIRGRRATISDHRLIERRRKVALSSFSYVSC